MSKRVLIIGAGGVGNVVVKKCAMLPEIFGTIMLASRTLSKCGENSNEIGGNRVQTAQVDADNVPELVALIKGFKPDLVVNVALPYQDLPIMDACLETGVHYLDTANYEPKDVAKFEYSWQWAYQERFREKGIMALLGCGFDHGVTGVFTAYANKHHFDEMHYLDIWTATPATTAKPLLPTLTPKSTFAKLPKRANTTKTDNGLRLMPYLFHKPIEYPHVRPRKSYLLYHEELKSLVKNFPSLRHRPILDDLWATIHHTPKRTAKCRHDPHQPSNV